MLDMTTTRMTDHAVPADSAGHEGSHTAAEPTIVAEASTTRVESGETITRRHDSFAWLLVLAVAAISGMFGYCSSVAGH